MKIKHIDPIWLRNAYEHKGFSTYDIAKIVGCDPKTVYSKLRALGVPTRPRGANLAGEDNYHRTGLPNPFRGKKHTDATKRIMSQKASVPKPYLRGSANGMYGRTGASNPNWRGGTTPERQAMYAKGEWKELVKGVYCRDQYRCVKCGKRNKGKRGLHAHHLRPWATNPDFRFSADNLVTLCRDCHCWVHSKANTMSDFLPTD